MGSEALYVVAGMVLGASAAWFIIKFKYEPRDRQSRVGFTPAVKQPRDLLEARDRFETRVATVSQSKVAKVRTRRAQNPVR